jgi:hypothetical protein
MARIAREQRDLCDRGVSADEEIRQYPGAATSSITVALKHLTSEKQRRPWYLNQPKSDISENSVSFLDTRVTDLYVSHQSAPGDPKYSLFGPNPPIARRRLRPPFCSTVLVAE